jgi:large subunit ribosomal protein L25
MAEAMTLEASKREEHGTRQARSLRQRGQLPAVLYGHKEATVTLSVSTEAMHSLIRHGVRVVDLRYDGKTEKCFIREVQWDAIGREVLHVDFTRVSLDERIQVTVPVMVRGTAPGVNAGGILEQPMHTIEIECLAINVPDAIRVNVHDLQLEQAIHVRDLVLPEGVKALEDPDALVVQIVKPLEEPEAAPAEAAEGPAEPEVIGRRAGEEEESERA